MNETDARNKRRSVTVTLKKRQKSTRYRYEQVHWTPITRQSVIPNFCVGEFSHVGARLRMLSKCKHNSWTMYTPTQSDPSSGLMEIEVCSSECCRDHKLSSPEVLVHNQLNRWARHLQLQCFHALHNSSRRPPSSFLHVSILLIARVISSYWQQVQHSSTLAFLEREIVILR